VATILGRAEAPVIDRPCWHCHWWGGVESRGFPSAMTIGPSSLRQLGHEQTDIHTTLAGRVALLGKDLWLAVHWPRQHPVLLPVR
jgi:hypothetical protein